MSKVYGRGRLTDEDRSMIEQLAEKGFSSGQIAQRLQRHPCTVAWYMYSHGLKAPAPTPEQGGTYLRGGRIVRKWSRDEEAAAVELRKQGLPYREIAARLRERFDTNRSLHSVQVRLVMIAARDEEAA